MILNEILQDIKNGLARNDKELIQIAEDIIQVLTEIKQWIMKHKKLYYNKNSQLKKNSNEESLIENEEEEKEPKMEKPNWQHEKTNETSKTKAKNELDELWMLLSKEKPELAKNSKISKS